MILGTGIDIIEVSRVKKLMRGSPRFVERWFSAEEISYCSALAKPHLHFAARLAGKEAVVKALRLVWDGPPNRREISITDDGRGVPHVTLCGAVRQSAEQAGVRVLHISLSHTDAYACASAVAES